MPCDYDPRVLKDATIGMLHCPQCGEMVLAGIPHPDYKSVDYSDIPPAGEYIAPGPHEPF